jgi:hypothetical protein
MAKVTIILEDAGDGVSLSTLFEALNKTGEKSPAEQVGLHALFSVKRMLSQLAGDESTVLQQAETFPK